MVFIDMKTRLNGIIASPHDDEQLCQALRLLLIYLETPQNLDNFRKSFEGAQRTITLGEASWASWEARSSMMTERGHSFRAYYKVFRKDVQMVKDVLGSEAALILGYASVLDHYRKSSRKASPTLLRSLMDFLDERSKAEDGSLTTIGPDVDGTRIIDGNQATARKPQVYTVPKWDHEVTIRFEWSPSEAIALIHQSGNWSQCTTSTWNSFEVAVSVLQELPFKTLSKSIMQTPSWQAERAEGRTTTACLIFTFPDSTLLDVPGFQDLHHMFVEAIVPEASLGAILH